MNIRRSERILRKAALTAHREKRKLSARKATPKATTGKKRRTEGAGAGTSPSSKKSRTNVKRAKEEPAQPIPVFRARVPAAPEAPRGYSTAVRDFNMAKPSLPTLAQLIFDPDEEVLTGACSALSYLSGGPNEKIQAVVEAGVCRRLVELLLHPSPAVQTPALRTIGNIVTGNDSQTQFIINNNALPCLLSLLSSPKKGIRKDACWAISNITAGNKDLIQAVIDNNIIPPLVQLLTDAEFDIRKDAAWAISNAISGGSSAQIKFLVQQGCVRPLCDLLAVNDARIVTIALDALENILKVGDEDPKASGTHNHMATHIAEADGLTKIEDLQQHSNNDIYEKCIKILEAYFGVEDKEETPELAPEKVEWGSGAH